MLRRTLALAFLNALLLGLFGCTETEVAFVSVANADPQPLGDRKLFVALTPADGDLTLTPALQLALVGGADGPGDINLDWGALEPSPGRFVDPDGILAWARANLRGRPVNLTLAPIQTTYVSVPPDLQGRQWDDPNLIARFLDAMDYVAGALQGVPILTVAIGNEVDIVLLNDQRAWDAYSQFFEAAAAQGRTLWPQADIGVKLTHEALTRNTAGRTGALVARSDAVLATYYPEIVPANRLPAAATAGLRELVSVAGTKPVHIVEIGYPSSRTLGSSPADQSAFVGAAFMAWDEFSERIPSLCFVWLHDLTPETVQALTIAYGVDDPNFRAWLSSLGMVTPDGIEKPAFERFRIETAARR